MRLDIRRIAAIKKADAAIGNRVRVKIVKNKLAAPFKEAEFDIMFNEGISTMGDLLDLAVKADIVKKSGSWFSFGDERLGQGRDGVKEFLAQNTDLSDKIKALVLEHYGLAAPPAERVGATAEKTAIQTKAAKKPSRKAPAVNA